MPTDARSAALMARARLVGWGPVAVTILWVALAALPLGLGNFWLRVMTTALMYAGLSQAMNIMVGLAGWPALGQVVFFGVGAYSAGLMSTKADASPIVAVAWGAAVAAIYALVASRAMLSLRGAYFLMATVALNFATLEFVLVARELTNGAFGVQLDPVFTGTPQEVYRAFYYVFFGILAVSSVILLFLRRSRLGYGLLAIKGNEDAALMLGVPTFRYRAVAWATSAAITGAIGGVYAFWIGYIDPESVFNLLISLGALLMVALGGRLLIIGPIIGALLFELVGVVVWANFDAAHLAVLGILLVVTVRFLPGGLPELADRMRRVRRPRQGVADAA